MLFDIVNQLEKGIKIPDATKGENKLRAAALKIMAPVLQLNNMPAMIDIEQYKNPNGPTNPNGDYISLYRLSDLANNISQFAEFYFPSGNKIDKVYKDIVEGASVKPDATFTNNTFYKSKQELANSRLSNLGGTPDDWYPVYATPADWHDQITETDNLFTAEIDFTNPSQSFNSQFVIIGDQTDQALSWKQLNANGQFTAIALNPDSVFDKIRFKFMQVQLNRPWLNFEIFSMGGWYLGGQKAGFISTGDISNNGGIFPLYPVSFIVATDLEIVGNLAVADLELVSDSIRNEGNINLGPFNINSISTDSTNNTQALNNKGYFIMAWISQLVDLSPQTDN